MPSKNIKVAFGQNTRLVEEVSNALHAFVFFPDCFVERIIVELISKDYKKLYGPELTVGWLEDNLFSPGLFGGEGPFLVLESDKVSSKVKDFLLDRELPADNRILFFAHKKLQDKKLFKVIDQITYEGPKFWEMAKYIDVLGDFFGLKISAQVKNYLVASLEPDAGSYYNALMILSSYGKGRELGLDEVKSVIRPQHLDNFAQADLFNAQNVKRLFLSLLIIENDYDIYRGFFSFIQGHVLKIMDPGYTSKKPRPSKYDQGIIAASRRWQKEELVSMLEVFSQLEVMAKQKNIWLRDEIRKIYLNS